MEQVSTMEKRIAPFMAVALLLGFITASAAPRVEAQSAPAGPAGLRVDDLVTPLGIDDATPRFSWQLQDEARGARQTAYEVQVASSAELLAQGKADVWTSAHIQSGASLNVRYAGPALKPSTRYYWRVKLWGGAGKPYGESAASWWETGLLTQAAWHASWIGYETPEEAAVRHAHSVWVTSPDAKSLAAEKHDEQDFAYRHAVTLAKPVKSAALYAAGFDTVSAWINGAQVLAADPFPPYKQMPWKKFVRADVTGKLSQGANTIAVEVVHYVANPNGMASDNPPPMMATLVVSYDDGTVGTFSSGTEWKTAVHAASGWEQQAFDDSAWKFALVFKQVLRPGSDPLGNPWIPDSVKALRNTFSVDKPVKSARLYATALGAYELFLNDDRVGNEVLAPGWTDYRQHVKYQTYDVTAQVKSGDNAIGALLAPGWYETPLEWFQQPNNYGDTPPALKAQLRIEHTDGSVEWVATDKDWLAFTTSILHSELYDGESQDARLATPGWDTAGYNASSWKASIAIEPKPVKIEAQDFQPIRVERTLTAKTMTEPKPGVYVYDFGQNFSGVEQLRVQGPAGTDVRVRFAEIVNDDGTIYIDNLRTAKATDHFILSGNGVEELTPQFTFPASATWRSPASPRRRTRARSPDLSSTPTRLSPPSSTPAAPCSTSYGATFSGASAPTSWAFPPTARSATSGSAGWATPRSSGAPRPTTWTSRPSRASSAETCAPRRQPRPTTASTRREP